MICNRKFRVNMITPNQYSHTAHCMICCKENAWPGAPEPGWTVEDGTSLSGAAILFPFVALTGRLLLVVMTETSGCLNENCCGTGSSGRPNAISRQSIST